MRLIPTVLSLAFVVALAGAAHAQTPDQAAPAPPMGPAWQRYVSATEVQLRNVAAFVRVTPENRTDVAIAITNPGVLRAPEVSRSGRRLIVDGKLRGQIRGCHIAGAGFQVDTTRQGRLTAGQVLTIDIRVPQSAVVSASGAVRLQVGPSHTARVRLDGCGDADIERVEEMAEVSVSGSQGLRLYDVGTAEVALAGAGDVVLGVVRDGLTASIAGSGDVTVARADGPTNIAVQGSGDVLIREGRATTLSIAIAGSGDVVHNGSAERLDAAIFGAGDVRVRRVDGQVTRRVLGGGEVIVGR